MSNTALSPTSLLKKLEEENQQLKKELQQWKANHAEMVKRAALLRERSDLPVDRIPAYKELIRLQQLVSQLNGGSDLFGPVAHTMQVLPTATRRFAGGDTSPHYLQPFNRYHEDMGNVLWFHFPSFNEPPEIMCGSTKQCNFDAQVWTHFTVFNFEDILKQRMGAWPEAA